LGRFGPDAEIFGDQQEWREARQVVTDLMDRYQRRTTLSS
jgi:hypothetical protein